MIEMANVNIIKQTYVEAFKGFDKLGDRIINKFQLIQYCEWIPLTTILNLLSETERKVGKSTVKKIGTLVPRHVPFRDTDLDFDTFITVYLNKLYSSNHQNVDSGFLIKRIENGYTIDLSRNPYSFDFNLGLVQGFANLYLDPLSYRIIEHQSSEVIRIEIINTSKVYKTKELYQSLHRAKNQ